MADPITKVRRDYTASKKSGTRSASSISYFVIHVAEAALPTTGAEAIGRYFASDSSRGSTHFGVDNNSTQRYLSDLIVAWGAPPLNVSGLHCESVGKSSFGRHQWLKEYGPTFQRFGWLIANRCRKYKIPLILLDAQDLKRLGKSPAKGGITTHAAVSAAWHESDHTDPGSGYPLDVLFAWIHFYAQGWLKAKTSKPVLHLYSQGKWVKRLQADLAANDLYNGPRDGHFTKQVETAVKHFQKHHKLKVDGVVGLKTWKAIDAS